jgi:prepilin peptidase CpaA
VAGLAITVFVSTAAWFDATTHRIPNKVTVAGLAVALILRAPLGMDTVVRGLAGFGLAFLISGVLYALRGIGGGDVKLLGGVGAFLGSSEVVGALALIAILGGAFALVNVISRGLLPLLLLNTLDLVKDLVKSGRSLGQAGPVRNLGSPGALTIPYAVPIAAGTLVWWFGNGVRL